MDVPRDMYDLLSPERATELRRHNKERLAELDAEAPARRARLAGARAWLEQRGRRLD